MCPFSKPRGELSERTPPFQENRWKEAQILFCTLRPRLGSASRCGRTGPGPEEREEVVGGVQRGVWCRKRWCRRRKEVVNEEVVYKEAMYGV